MLIGSNDDYEKSSKKKFSKMGNDRAVRCRRAGYSSDPPVTIGVIRAVFQNNSQ
jgi:hypothetical protein